MPRSHNFETPYDEFEWSRETLLKNLSAPPYIVFYKGQDGFVVELIQSRLPTVKEAWSAVTTPPKYEIA